MFYCISKWFIMFCLFIQITEIDAFLKLGYSPSLVIINQEDESSHLNHLGIEINQIQGFHLQNFCAIFAERNAKFFFLCEKKQQFAQSFAKVISRKIALFCFCETQVLRNSATRVFAQLRNFVKIKPLVTVYVSQNSILEKYCFGTSSYWSLLLN